MANSIQLLRNLSRRMPEIEHDTFRVPMSNDRANLVNPEPLGDEVSDGLASGVVKVNVGTGGAIGNSLVSGATEQNIERRPCDCEYNGNIILCPVVLLGLQPNEDRYCRVAKWDLP